MFSLTKMGVYYNINRPHYNGILKITSIGSESMRFIDPSLINNAFKKINVLVLILDNNHAITEDGVVPHTVVTDVDLKAVEGHATTTAIVEAAARRAAFNAGVTVGKDSLQLVAVSENTDVYYIYMATVGKKLHDNVEKTRIANLSNTSLCGICSLTDLM